MTHIDLFSGIGGFAYAARQVWGDEYENLFFCENNKFCQEAIKKNFGKDSLIYGDIREVTADIHYGRQEKQKQQATGNKQYDRSIGLLTGGFPCQPFSVAGKRRSTEDDRHLWPEMLRVIKDFKPRWVIAENVRGLINIANGVVFQQVCSDLEAEDYKIQPFIIPAVAVNAPHRRDRVWIIAYARCEYRYCQDETPDGFIEEIAKGTPQYSEHRESKTDRNAPNTHCAGYERKINKKRQSAGYNRGWEQHWYEVATRLCRMDDGLPAALDGFKLTKAHHRAERLKALGNAIVPQVVMEIMKAIKCADRGEKW